MRGSGKFLPILLAGLMLGACDDGSPETGRLELAGLDVTVTPQAAVALGLIFHELATNAAKYGALSNPDGRILIAGRRGEDGSLALQWTERNGPPVTPPTRSGFGRTVITRSLSYSDGGAEMDFLPEGVVCRIRLPKADLTDEPVTAEPD